MSMIDFPATVSRQLEIRDEKLEIVLGILHKILHHQHNQTLLQKYTNIHPCRLKIQLEFQVFVDLLHCAGFETQNTTNGTPRLIWNTAKMDKLKQTKELIMSSLLTHVFSLSIQSKNVNTYFICVK
eukprot:763350_1